MGSGWDRVDLLWWMEGGEVNMFLRDKDKPMVSRLLMFGSVAAVVLSILGALGVDLYLASTQWLLVSGVMAAWGVYLLLEAEFRS